MGFPLLVTALILAVGVTSEADGPRNVPMTPAELGIHHLLIPGTIDGMAEADGQKTKSSERRTVQVHVFVKATITQAGTVLKGMFFMGELRVPCCPCSDHGVMESWFTEHHSTHVEGVRIVNTHPFPLDLVMMQSPSPSTFLTMTCVSRKCSCMTPSASSR